MARIDASQVDRFAQDLAQASRRIEEAADDFEQKWGEEWVDEMKQGVPLDTGRGRDSIEQVAPGEITMEGYLVFPERGTSRMAPQPFIRPARLRIQPKAVKDAGEQAVNLIRRGR